MCLVLGFTDENVCVVFRHATPYHAPVYLAQAKGFFNDEGVKVALLEPNDPSVRLDLMPTSGSSQDAG